MDCGRVSVTYETPPHAGFFVAASPIIFWVDTQTNLIVRKEHEVTIKPPDGDLRTTKHTSTLIRFVVDQPILQRLSHSSDQRTLWIPMVPEISCAARQAASYAPNSQERRRVFLLPSKKVQRIMNPEWLL
jgi:hypothetical protein